MQGRIARGIVLVIYCRHSEVPITEGQMLKWFGLAVLLFPCMGRAQDVKPVEKSSCATKPEVLPPVQPDKKDKKKAKKKVPENNLIPLSVVVCEVENALDAYQQSPEVTDTTDANPATLKVWPSVPKFPTEAIPNMA